MMSALQREAESQIYFTTNWSTTSIQYPDMSPPFDSSALSEYIRLNYVNTDNESSGTGGRQSGYGYLQVFVYHKVRKLSVGRSDDVKAFFDCKNLPYDIHSKVGVQFETQDLDNGFFVTLVQFPIEQHS